MKSGVVSNEKNGIVLINKNTTDLKKGIKVELNLLKYKIRHIKTNLQVQEKLLINFLLNEKRG